MSWGHYYYKEQVSYETPTYYDEPTYGTTPAYTPFDDEHAVDVMHHSCDNFTNSSSYSPHSEQLTTYVQGDYTGPFSNPQGPQYDPDNDYTALHSPLQRIGRVTQRCSTRRTQRAGKPRICAVPPARTRRRLPRPLRRISGPT
jgi:hypothetical protein